MPSGHERARLGATIIGGGGYDWNGSKLIGRQREVFVIDEVANSGPRLRPIESGQITRFL